MGHLFEGIDFDYDVFKCVSAITKLFIAFVGQLKTTGGKTHLTKYRVDFLRENDLLCLNATESNYDARVVKGNVFVLLVVHVSVAEQLEELLKENFFIYVDLRNYFDNLRAKNCVLSFFLFLLLRFFLLSVNLPCY